MLMSYLRSRNITSIIYDACYITNQKLTNTGTSQNDKSMLVYELKMSEGMIINPYKYKT